MDLLWYLDDRVLDGEGDLQEPVKVVVTLEGVPKELSVEHFVEHKEDLGGEDRFLIAESLMLFPLLESVVTLEEELHREGVILHRGVYFRDQVELFGHAASWKVLFNHANSLIKAVGGMVFINKDYVDG